MHKSLKFIAVAILILGVVGIGWYLNFSISPVITSNGRVVKVDATTYALYLDIENEGAPDSLRGVTSVNSGKAMFMGIPDGFIVAIPEKSKVSFSSDGAHIMLREVGNELSAGTFVSVELKFENAGRVPAKAIVESEENEKAEVGDSSTHDRQMGHSMHGKNNTVNIEHPDSAPKITVSVNVNSEGGYDVDVTTQNFKFVKPAEDSAKHVDGEGHAHLYLNGLKSGRMYSNKAKVGKLPVGKHQISVVLNSNDHRAYSAAGQTVEAVTEIEVSR